MLAQRDLLNSAEGTVPSPHPDSWTRESRMVYVCVEWNLQSRVITVIGRWSSVDIHELEAGAWKKRSQKVQN